MRSQVDSAHARGILRAILIGSDGRDSADPRTVFSELEISTMKTKNMAQAIKRHTRQ